ncbi:uncharacterized protein VDAG_02527 [Verticillium dahliae VdLs.17]|uniref:Uncharacterized protein n=1 Tax=Verticillium dahliae (strain VdLs.17 / ATCC MYA-4575 / FGSC 10137) TaxID=498257 RepID=G2WY45_VERDV|nr:uncharacterized protein VDAG_02527 [Verticillium dahliae VdLs.17]EGY21003.1 hypothetical protein VDAG_02527 [Verticillium dahliae VdLs.17]
MTSAARLLWARTPDLEGDQEPSSAQEGERPAVFFASRICDLARTLSHTVREIDLHTPSDLPASVVSETMPRAKTPASPGVVPGKVKKKGQGQAIQTAASMSTSASSSASTAATASSNAPPPAWPPFKPALPVTDLLPEPLEQCPDKVVLLPNFWPKSLCNTFVAFLRGLALETTPGGRPKRNMAARVNDRFQVDDPAFARRLWLGTGLRDALQREDVRALWSVEPVFSSPFPFFIFPEVISILTYVVSHTLMPSCSRSSTAPTLLLLLLPLPLLHGAPPVSLGLAAPSRGHGFCH